MKLPLNQALQWVRRDGEKRHDWKHINQRVFTDEPIKVVVTINVMDWFKSIGFESPFN